MKKIKKYTRAVIVNFKPEEYKEMEKTCKKINLSVSEFIRFSTSRSLADLNTHENNKKLPKQSI